MRLPLTFLTRAQNLPQNMVSEICSWFLNSSQSLVATILGYDLAPVLWMLALDLEPKP